MRHRFRVQSHPTISKIASPAEPDYYSGKGTCPVPAAYQFRGLMAVNRPLIAAKERGADGGAHPLSTWRAIDLRHISQFPIGTYNRHPPMGPARTRDRCSRARLFTMCPGMRSPRRFRLGRWALSLCHPCVVSSSSTSTSIPARRQARYLAANTWTPRNAQSCRGPWISTSTRADTDRYADERRPLVLRLFPMRVARHGMQSRMEYVYAAVAGERGAESGGVTPRAALGRDFLLVLPPPCGKWRRLRIAFANSPTISRQISGPAITSATRGACCRRANRVYVRAARVGFVEGARGKSLLLCVLIASLDCSPNFARTALYGVALARRGHSVSD